MKTAAVSQVNILPYQSGLSTVPFKAPFPEVDSITYGRILLRLSEGENVMLVSHDRSLTVSHQGTAPSMQKHVPGLSEGELRLYAQNRNAQQLLHHMFPVFRINGKRKHTDANSHVWFAPQASFNTDADDAMMQNAASIGGLIQDVALMGRDAIWEGGLEFLDQLRGPVTYQEPLGHEVDKLHYLFTEGVDPAYGELAHLVLGFAHAVSTNEILPPQDEVSLEQVFAAAEKAIHYFDVQTVANALVVGALDAAARLEGEEGKRAAGYSQRLQEVMDISHAFATRAESLEQLADDVHSLRPINFLGAVMLLMVGHEHLKAARVSKYMGLRSQRVRAARTVFDAAHDRMYALKGETNVLRPVLMGYAKRQIGVIG